MTTKAMNAPLQKGKSRLNRNNGWDYLMIGFLVLFALICVYPFWYVMIGSFSDGADYMRGGVYLWPREWSLQNYQVTLVDSRLWIGFRVTIARTFICTITHVLFTAMVAYAMSRNDLPCRKFIYWFNMFTMFFGGGLIPFYILLKQLKLINTFWVYVIPGLYSVYNMIICSNYFRSHGRRKRVQGLLQAVPAPVHAGAGDHRPVGGRGPLERLLRQHGVYHQPGAANPAAVSVQDD